MARNKTKATKASKDRSKEEEPEHLFILRPPTLGTAKGVADYLEGEFAAVLRAMYDVLSAGAHCPLILLDDLGYVANAMARVLRGEPPVGFEDESLGFTDEPARSLRELTGRLDGSSSYRNTEGHGAELWDSTLPILSRLLGRAETVLRVESEWQEWREREERAVGVAR